MFSYYREEMLADHYPFANEIARMMLGGLYTKNGNFAVTFVSEFLNERLKRRKQDRLYYQTQYGLKQVFENKEDIQALQDTILASVSEEESISARESIAHCRIRANGKLYRIYFRKNIVLKREA